MGTEKKAESSWEQPEQLGPYRIQEQVPQPTHSQGELYRATHETSGATALVLKPSTEDGAVPLTDWSVRCVSSASPGYVAMEVEHTPWSVAPDRQSVESLVFTFEDVHKGVRCMAQVVPTPHEPLPWRRLGLALAGAAGVCAVLLLLVLLNPESQPPNGTDPVERAAPTPVSHEVLTAAEQPDPFVRGWLAYGAPQRGPVLSSPLPREPFKGQKRPPCTRYVYVELVGACWMPHELKAPCPDDLYEHQGKCYAPVFSGKPPPQSLGQ